MTEKDMNIHKNRTAKKAIAGMLTLLLSAVILFSVNGTCVSAASAKKAAKKQYTLSKGAGSYQKSVTVKIKAKKGYKVYYTLDQKRFTKKKVIAGGKSKKLTFTKTTTLKLLAVKKNTKITAKLLKKKKFLKKAVSYVYTIKDEQGQGGGQDDQGDGGKKPGPGDGDPKDGGGTVSGDTVSGNTGVIDPGEHEAQDPRVKRELVLPTVWTGVIEKPDAPFALTDAEGAAVSENSISVESVSENGITETILTIKEGGAYKLSGLAENLFVRVTAASDVDLLLDGFYADNRESLSDEPAISITEKIKTRIIISGENEIAGAAAYAKSPASALISQDAKKGSLTLQAATGDAVLVLSDGLSKEDAKEASSQKLDLTGGIAAKGTLTVESGTYGVVVQGDALKGTNGGIRIKGGSLFLTAAHGSGLLSKSGKIEINGGDIVCSCAEDAVKAYDKSELTAEHSVSIKKGTLAVVKSGGYGIRSCVVNISGGNVLLQGTEEDAIRAKAGTVLDPEEKILQTADDGSGLIKISGGLLLIRDCEGDGLQGENIEISDGQIDIVTTYAYAATRFYGNGSISAYVNTVTSFGQGAIGTTRTERVKVDTGSHSGIKAGTKEKIFSYASVKEGSPYEADTAYVQTASGNLEITGGTIRINTTATGLNYNRSGDYRITIGSPGDGINCGNTGHIGGGDITIEAGDDGIAVGDTLRIDGEAQLDINTAYEGIEARHTVIGNSGSETGPSVTIYPNDDGINASSKVLTYKYDDEEEETYTKKSVSIRGSSCTMHSGYLNIVNGDDVKYHEVVLKNFDGESSEITFSSMGDGIDCNGTFTAYGGTIVIYAMPNGPECPLDAGEAFLIDGDAELFLVGSDVLGDTKKLTTTGTPFVVFSDNASSYYHDAGSGFGSMVQSRSGTAVAILDEEDHVMEAAILPKTGVFFLYASPKLTEGKLYTFSTGGEASGLKDAAHPRDYRYLSYTGGKNVRQVRAVCTRNS